MGGMFSVVLGVSAAAVAWFLAIQAISDWMQDRHDARIARLTGRPRAG